MPRRTWYFLAVFLSLSLQLIARDKPVFPKQIAVARYVMVTTYFGDDLTNPRISAEDRRAVVDVERAIQKWGKYTLAHQREDADIIIVVRKGRIAEAGGGVGVHGGSNEPVGTGYGVHGELGDPDDTIAVYDPHLGTDVSPLWRSRSVDGLEAPEMKLIAELRKQVEEAAKKP